MFSERETELICQGGFTGVYNHEKMLTLLPSHSRVQAPQLQDAERLQEQHTVAT